MLRIRAEQTRELQRQIALGQLQEDMIVHLRNFAPNDAEAIGDDGVRRAVRFGAERARVYGVTNAGLLRFHVELMFMFGGLFDTDPLLPWAREILVDPDISDEEARSRSLHDAMLVYLDAVAGPDRSFARETLHRVGRVRLENLSGANHGREQEAVDALLLLDPVRGAHLGAARLRGFVRYAAEAANRRSLATDRGIAIVTLMMFVMGHGFAEDPLFPWASATFADTSLADPDARVARLERGLATYVERALRPVVGRPPHGRG